MAKRLGGTVVAVVAALAMLVGLSVVGPPVYSAGERPVLGEVVDGGELVVGALEGDFDHAIAPPPDEFEGEVVVEAPPAALRSPFAHVTPQSGTWAVSIGINDYPGRSHDLLSAVNDARDMDGALARLGVAHQRRLLLTDRQASRSAISKSVSWLVANSASDATAVFFFAGHVRRQSASTQALVGADGGVITDVELANLLRPLAARRVWVIIAGCYGGGFTEVLGAGRVLTAAAPADQLAYESTAFYRSYLVEFMIRRGLLEGAADKSVEAAFDFAVDEMGSDYPHRLPVQFDQYPGELRLDPASLGVSPEAVAEPLSTRVSSDGSPSQESSEPSEEPANSPSPSESPSPESAEPAPKPKPYDKCRSRTLGLVTCS